MNATAVSKGHQLMDALPVHSAAIAVLHRQCFDEAWSTFTVQQVLAMPGAFGLLAVTSEPGVEARLDLLGFAMCRAAADECELLSLAVEPEIRRHGIAAALLAAAMDRARDGATNRMFLEVAEDNSAAQQLYCNFGFRPVGRRPNYYRRRQGPAMAALTYAVLLES